jgi:hypothetical protein
MRFICGWGRFWLKCAITVAIVCCLSGCVGVTTGIDYSHFNGGEFSQSVRIDDRLQQLAAEEIRQWFDSIAARGEKLAAKVARSDREINLSLPFWGDRDLVAKFQQLFPPSNEPDAIAAKLAIDDRNFVFCHRHQLSYDLYLPALPETSSQHPVVSFLLKTPYGGKAIDTDIPDAALLAESENRQLHWQLTFGQNNHLAAVFWTIDPLAVGGLLIAIVSLASFFYFPRRSQLG